MRTRPAAVQGWSIPRRRDVVDTDVGTGFGAGAQPEAGQGVARKALAPRVGARGLRRPVRSMSSHFVHRRPTDALPPEGDRGLNAPRRPV